MPKPPVLPADFDAIVVQPSDTIGDAEVKVNLRLPELRWKLLNYMFTGNQLSEDFKQQICEEIDCATNTT